MRHIAHGLALWAIATLALLAGCNHRTDSTLGNRVGVALTVNGGSAPTGQQTQLVLNSIRPELERQGFILVTDLSAADRIIRVDFTPDEFFPEIAGNAVVLGWRVNPAVYRGYGSGNYAVQPFISAYYASNYGYDRYDYDSTRYDSRGSTTRSSPPNHNARDPKDGTKPEERNRDRDHARREGDRDRDGDKTDQRGDGHRKDGDRNRGGDHNRDNRPPIASDRSSPTYVSSPSSSSGGSYSNSSYSSSSSNSGGSTSSSSYSAGSSSYSASSSSSSYSPPSSSSSSSSSPSTTTVSHQNE